MNILDYLPRDGVARNEERIERLVEYAFNVLDRHFLKDGSTMSQTDYDMASDAIRKWADLESRFSPRAA